MWDKEEILAFGCDHAGYELKEFLIKILNENGYNIKDYGTFLGESIDYPDIIHPIANAINCKEYKMGIIICGTGNGVSMTANKYPNVRAALCWNEDIVKLARLHNDANMLALPARFIERELALKMVYVYLNTGFEGGRHEKRVKKISIQ